MKTVIKFTGGKISPVDFEKLNNHLTGLKDGEYTIEVKRHYKNRTIPQNRLLWDIYRQVSEQTGYETEEIHAMMGQKFLLDESGKSPFVKSTTKLTTIEFNVFIKKIVRFFSVEASLQIYLPEDYRTTTEVQNGESKK